MSFSEYLVSVRKLNNIGRWASDFMETIKGTAKGQGKYKKQSGGRGQYGDVWIEMEPLPRGGGFEFVNKIVGGAVPKQFIPAVEKGIYEAAKEGAMAGYPMSELAKTVNVLVESELNITKLNVDTETVKYYRKKVESLSRHKAEEVLKDYELRDEWYNDKTDELYVWMVIRK